MTHDDMIRAVWRMHDAERMPISAIARRLGTSEAIVRACITETWGMSNSERIAVGLKAVRGWEDE